MNEFVKLLGAYGVDFIYYGKQEREVSPGCDQRWRGWGHILDLATVFDLGPNRSHTSIYAVRKNLNAVRGITIAESPTALPLAQQEPGRSMFEGGFGIGNGQFQEPRGLCLDSKSRVYVTDTRNYRLQVFERNGEYFGQVGVRGADAGQFEEPMDVAVDKAGLVYVLDTWNHRVQVFDAKGVPQGMIARDFYGPRGIAIDLETNFIYVTDTGHHVVKVFDSSGRLIRTIGDPAFHAGSDEGQFNAPVGIDITADGLVAVADTLNDRIQFFDRQGQYLRSWPVGFTMQPNRGVEAHLVAAPDETIYVADPLGGRVLAFGADGSKTGAWDRASTGDRLQMPNGLALTPDGELLVTDLQSHKVMRLRVRP
jgi:DNA-binding beta-propeller fold protein YncE